MNDKKLILVKCVTLLFRESQLPNITDNSSDLVKTIISNVLLPDVSVGLINTERDLLGGLKEICMEMCAFDASHQYSKTELLQRIRHVTRDEESLYTSFSEGIEIDLDENELKKFCINLRFSLNDHQREEKVTQIISAAARKIRFERDKITSISQFVAEVQTELEPYLNTTKTVDPAIVNSIDLGDSKSIENVLGQARELNDDKGIMKFGWQALNRMTQGGLRRGECVVIGALQHNFKTGMTLSLFKHIALYNKPYMLNPKKKPLLLRISFEDPLSLNLPFLYRNIYENKTGKIADINGKSLEELSEYITRELTINGYHIKMMHVNPSLWTYRDLCNKILELEAEGYEIHLCMLDYLPMLPTTGCMEGGPIGSPMRDMYRRVRNFFSSRKISLVTPHQLSTEAKMLIRNGLEESFVKEIANKGYYDGCRTIDQEVDLELYIHKVIVDGKSYLTIQRGKHRVIIQTPEEHKFCVLPFHDVGDIRDDINDVDTSTKRPGAIKLSNGEEKPNFFQFHAE
jgi:hypothetical protein